jgi:ferredoxin
VLIGDCASDPPLSATARGLAIARADDVVYGLGAVALARGHRELALATRDPEARAALARALTAIGGRARLIDADDAWPAVAAGSRDELLPADALVQVADAARGRPAAAYLTVAGAVREPRVLACAPSTTMAELVALAGGSDDDDWVPIAGGAPAGRLVARDDRLDQVGSPSLVLVLPAGHAWARRLRTPVADWIWRAASACASCRACSDGCPAALAPHALVAAVAGARDDGGVAPAAALDCTGCGLCDALCPSALSPRALVVGVRDELRRRGGSGGARTLAVGLDRALLTLRLGLAGYERAVDVTRL